MPLFQKRVCKGPGLKGHGKLLAIQVLLMWSGPQSASIGEGETVEAINLGLGIALQVPW